ncbi:uncharacterized membrane protein YvlD (DUF360 family) [Tamaricihabitans halophyticus]|uniref:Uncharacterized membrane protein YvlD (DUF360 family) n=1 Tax=Tamaricihabitans halophyticus TaxID=1262583 RepID=A0A4R2QYQ3_9PSEU|nr:phage holin family protein [Tamaricihabitans halophyticus]TCP54188.1 uncharacterized membrane protein YvlD (DUF360 family) [Tamaricihabitans halophyticus]
MTRAKREHHGRLFRRGRTAARTLLIWWSLTVALHVLSNILPGFSMQRWWQPTVCALLLGVLIAVVWPLVLRVALPIAVFTLGAGSFLLLGAGTLAIFYAVPGVRITDLRTAVIVVVAVSAVAAVISSLLAVDEDEIFFRRAARRSRKSSAGQRELPPGVLFLQVDGLGYNVVRRAVRDGDMPTLAAWLAEDTHGLRMWHTDWSSQTGASVCGILHGDNHDVIGFRWYEKDTGQVMACSAPRSAAEIERRHSTGEGLLAHGGSSRGNLFTGDAPQVSLTMSAAPVVLSKQERRVRGKRKAGAGYYAYFANPINALRTFGSAIVDVFRELLAAAKQRRANVQPRVNRGGFYPLARVGTTVLARDVVVSAILEDIIAGRPVVYADFLGYDEVAHHSGIERFDTLAVLRTIDQQIGRLHRASRLGPREYHLVVLSDHGQTQGRAFADRFGESIEQLVARLCGCPTADRAHREAKRSARKITEGWQHGAGLAEAAAGGGFVARRLRARVDGADSGEGETASTTAPGLVVLPSGHLAMVSFTEHPGRVPLETIERMHPRLLPALVDHPGVGFLLVHSEQHGPVVLGRDGLHRLATGKIIGADPLVDYGPHAADLIRRVTEFPHCADIMINSRYDPETGNASAFEAHIGSHGGLGGEQNLGFVVYPKQLTAPGDIVGAEQLHQLFRGWLIELGQLAPVQDPVESPTAAHVSQ